MKKELKQQIELAEKGELTLKEVEILSKRLWVEENGYSLHLPKEVLEKLK